MPAGRVAADQGRSCRPCAQKNTVFSAWQERRQLLSEAAALCRPLPSLNASQVEQIRQEERPLAYLCMTQVRMLDSVCDSLKTQSQQGLSGFDGCDAPRECDAAAGPGPGPTISPASPALPIAAGAIGGPPAGTASYGRLTGNLGPSLQMTAVEVQHRRPGLREAGEALGREALRIAAMTAEQRAKNDLPPALGPRETGGPDWMLEVRGFAAAAAAAYGLDPGAKSAHSTAGHGWKGLPATGRRSVRDAGALLEDHSGSLGFWTVTLPPEAAETATRGQIATFQSRLLFFARRMQIRRGVQPLAVVVCEMHPGRRAMDGALVPHWHAVVKVSETPYGRWSVTVADWHRVVAAAHRAAFGTARGHSKGCRMLPQRTGAARYLTKYISKAASTVQQHRDRQTGRMVPAQWWTWTGELRALVAACRVRPPAAFLRWCCRWRLELEALGEARTGLIQLPNDGPVIGAWFGWISPEALDRAISAWIASEIAEGDARGAPPDEGPPPGSWWLLDHTAGGIEDLPVH